MAEENELEQERLLKLTALKFYHESLSSMILPTFYFENFQTKIIYIKTVPNLMMVQLKIFPLYNGTRAFHI